jgi:hypothetical protein
MVAMRRMDASRKLQRMGNPSSRVVAAHTGPSGMPDIEAMWAGVLFDRT